MPKRRRLFTPLKNKAKTTIVKAEYDGKDEQGTAVKGSLSTKEVKTARGRLQGALMDVLEPPPAEESHSDSSSEDIPMKNNSQDRNYNSDDEDTPQTRYLRQRQSYVLKLFDRSVDLSQFDEITPLYPICRAWIANQPKADYRVFAKKQPEPEQNVDCGIELPGPEGPPVSRIPELLPEQLEASKDNINLNYREAPPPSKEQLLQSHMSRWVAVRQAWIEQANRVEARYDSTQQCLNKISVNAI